MYIEDEAVVKENVGKRVSGRGKTRRALTRQSGLYSARRPSLFPTLSPPQPPYKASYNATHTRRLQTTERNTAATHTEGCNQLSMELHSIPHRKAGATRRIEE